MAVIDTIKGTLSTAAETVSNVAQRFVEKNRTDAKLNRLRIVMKSESELINRAYIALGKQYYEMKKKGKADAVANQDKLFSVIETSKAKIARARDCYRKIIENQNEFLYTGNEETTEYKSEDVVDITVACSNENEYESSPFSETEEVPAEAESTKAPDEAEDTESLDEDEDTEAPDDELF